MILARGEGGNNVEISILKTIKTMLGIDPEDDVYTAELLVHINSAIMILTQIGVGPKEGFTVSSVVETWDEFLGSSKLLEGAKQFIYIKTKIGFDPPASSFVVEAMQQMANELVQRLNIQVDPGEEDVQNK